MRVLASFILYYPPEGIAQRVASVAKEVDGVLVIANSKLVDTCFDAQRSNFFSKLNIIQNNENLGIARALNQAAQHALANRYDWLLTMDQDSDFDSDGIAKMISFAARASAEIALVAPLHRTPMANPVSAAVEVQEIRMTMTSGNLLRLKAYQACGPFEEKLFIDSVDHEYCLRLRRKKWKIVRLNSVILFHELGKITYTPFAGMRLKTTHHNATRRYYVARNRLYVMFKYFWFDTKFFRREAGHYLKDYLRVIFLEQNRSAKIAAMLLGTWHFIIGRLGPR